MKCLKSEWEYKVKYGKSRPRITVQIPIDKNRTKEILVGTISEDDCSSPVCCCKEEHAIAKLIAAATDLLKACLKVINGGYGCAPSVEYMDSLKKECE